MSLPPWLPSLSDTEWRLCCALTAIVCYGLLWRGWRGLAAMNDLPEDR